jgi:drug/metabolite transporter (DMT)-like permease
MFTKADIEQYFNAEKNAGLIFIVIGAAAIITAVVAFFFIKTNFYKGAAIPLLAIGLLTGVVGFTVYNKSDNNRIRNVYAYDLNPTELREKEIPRMKTVMKNFSTYRWAELILAFAGISLFFYFKDNTDKIFWKGFAAALAIMALIAFTADYFAEKRGAVYLKGLESFIGQK